MPIIQLTETLVTQQCVVCDAERDIQVDTLTLGMLTPGGVEDTVSILMPRCACGAYEQLVRSLEAAPLSMQGHPLEHRKAVNALGERLKSLGNTHEQLVHNFAAEPPASNLPSVLPFKVSKVKRPLGRNNKL